MAQCIGMRARQIADMNVVANARAVRCRIIVAENIELAAQAERHFDRDLDQMRRHRARLSGAAQRIGAGDVEVAQDHVAEPVRRPASPSMISLISLDSRKARSVASAQSR